MQGNGGWQACLAIETNCRQGMTVCGKLEGLYGGCCSMRSSSWRHDYFWWSKCEVRAWDASRRLYDGTLLA